MEAQKPAPDESGVPCWQLAPLVRRLMAVSRYDRSDDLAAASGLDPRDVRRIISNHELWVGLRRVEALLIALDGLDYMDDRLGYLTFIPSPRRCHAVAMASYEALTFVAPEDEARVLAERREWIERRADELMALREALLTDPRVSPEAREAIERDRLRKLKRTPLRKRRQRTSLPMSQRIAVA